MPRSPHPPRLLNPCRISQTHNHFQSIQSWVYPEEPFYVRQVGQSLAKDIPQQLLHRKCTMWSFTDPAINDILAGFGILKLDNIYSKMTDELPHFYISLLSTNPGIKSYGYGGAIVRYLINEAESNYRRFGGKIPGLLFLDVYKKNEKAIELYVENGFEILNESLPTPDQDEGGELYYVMYRPLS